MSQASSSIGRLASDTICDTLVEQTIEFIWSCLIPWRDDPDRCPETAEEALNAQFHNFLESRSVSEFPMVLFQHEQKQEGRRRVDLSAKPRSPVIIRGTRYSHYEPFLLIEGKRLPAPSKDREREYVSGTDKITGGIQRFKLGLHGKSHETAIILAYLQKDTHQQWHSRINSWITDCLKPEPEIWQDTDGLFDLQDFGLKSRSISCHPRFGGCKTPEIRLLHFWIQMPPQSSN